MYYNSSFPKRQILDSSKLKKFADDKFKLDEKGGNFQKGKKTLWGKEKLFSKDLYCRHVKTRAFLGKC